MAAGRDLNPRPLPSSGYRESDPRLHHGKVMRYHYAISARSLPGESNPDRRRTKAACLPLSLDRHRSGSWTRTGVRPDQSRAGMPATHPGQ
jgi:hypothetical protein